MSRVEDEVVLWLTEREYIHVAVLAAIGSGAAPTSDLCGRRSVCLLGLSEDDEVALGRLLGAAFESDHESHVEGGGELAECLGGGGVLAALDA